ncbi:MAG: enoyl-CoA hydratase/isomerase [Hyphomonadaceae bacterium]|nr:enoyl-CoA hydratase/isomerase [Hyphomonadaceae bacterium]
MQKIRYERQGAVARIVMNDPGTLNAADPVMVQEMSQAFERASKEARCVLLTGEGRGFCSGANLSSGEDRAVDESGRIDLGDRLEKQYNPFILALRDLPIPIVTAVNGPAAGIGCSFALMGDLVFAGESAYFLQAFRRIGLIPDGGATFMLPRLVGRARALEMMLLGDKVPAKQAESWGLIYRCVPDGELQAQAMAKADELANGPTRALSLIRKLAWASADNSLEEQLAAERAAQRHAGHSNDFTEGVSAFLQKRPARFTGD